MSRSGLDGRVVRAIEIIALVCVVVVVLVAWQCLTGPMPADPGGSDLACPGSSGVGATYVVANAGAVERVWHGGQRLVCVSR